MSPTSVNLCAALRQGSAYTKSFFCQIESLTGKNYVLKSITIVLDGETLTDAFLFKIRDDPRVRFVFEGAPATSSCFMSERSIAWARVANLALEESLLIQSEFTLWVESDLSFPCDLIELLLEPNVDIVAPIIMLGSFFYDSWGFRDLSGRRIGSIRELQALPQGPGPLTELSSVGSCLLFRSSLLAQGIRLPSGYENGLLVGFCLAARALGARVFCRNDVAVVHPTSLWASQVYRIISLRLGSKEAWKELAPASGAIVAGPYFDFVTPTALQLLKESKCRTTKDCFITFATNAKREVAVLVSKSDACPPLPNGFGVLAPRQPLPISPTRWGRFFSD